MSRARSEVNRRKQNSPAETGLFSPRKGSARGYIYVGRDDGLRIGRDREVGRIDVDVRSFTAAHIHIREFALVLDFGGTSSHREGEQRDPKPGYFPHHLSLQECVTFEVETTLLPARGQFLCPVQNPSLDVAGRDFAPTPACLE